MIFLKGSLIKKFRKVHIEVTNICNLSCSFCPPKALPNQTMNLELFEKINQELQPLTNEVAYHLMGDPLILRNLGEYLDISAKYGLKVNITTTANNLKTEMFSMLAHGAIKQINFSINSYNANSHKKSLQEYLAPILEFCHYVLRENKDFFINFRIWNLDEQESAKSFNKEVFSIINQTFTTQVDLEEVYRTKPKNIRVARKIFLHFDAYFEWPSKNAPFVSERGYCYGLDSHFGILSSGKVVPCCLDKDGIMTLGNVRDDSLQNILHAPRATEIKCGFANNMLFEELCQKCEYRTRFDTKSK